MHSKARPQTQKVLLSTKVYALAINSTACAGIREHAVSILVEKQSRTQPAQCLGERMVLKSKNYYL